MRFNASFVGLTNVCTCVVVGQSVVCLLFMLLTSSL